ncbi:hypothetical protein FA95DRAFT_1602466 [Auriscalpium vulgare]|uniref:Uncharacterized protein n=1 Tax=Auriscalpium vulgare TaxID=40419 RepID=A0ACB8S625_9AGAM|nr:hypothetical protein FA95DRAFT_1602466 [Auriscalpium vulgare]
MSSKFASSFAPYAPPPDEQSYSSGQPPSSSSRFTRPWFNTQQPSGETSYQSGGIPAWDTSASGGMGSTDDAEEQTNQWETRYGMRVDVLAAFAYVLGPLSAFAVLMLETHNDYVRFHAYQSGLLATPLLLTRIFASILQLPSFLRTLFTLFLVLPPLYMAFRAYIDAAQNGLARFHLPGIGPLAEQWLEEE